MRIRGAWRSAAIILPVVASSVAIACGSGVYDGPRTTTCSNGPPLAGSIPPGRGSQQNLPACVPRCGGEQRYPGLNGPIYSTAALPSGRCSNDGEQCQLAAANVVKECPGQQARGCDVSHFECRCEGEDWRCYSLAPGGGTCLCGDVSGASDAAPLDAGRKHDATDEHDAADE